MFQVGRLFIKRRAFLHPVLCFRTQKTSEIDSRCIMTGMPASYTCILSILAVSLDEPIQVAQVDRLAPSLVRDALNCNGSVDWVIAGSTGSFRMMVNVRIIF